MMIDKTAVEALIAQGRAIGNKIEGPDGREYLIVPSGMNVAELQPLERRLMRIKAGALFEDSESFVAYVNRFKTQTTQVFAATSSPLVTAALDYHGPGQPSHCAHVAQYAPKLSTEWTRWTTAKPMPQAEFAEFVEENRRDVVEPAAAVLLDVVTKFKATKKQDYDSVVYQPNGDVTIAWSDKTEMAGKPGVAVPSELQLGIPVFFGGAPYKVPVFMRYRLADGKLTFTVKIDRADYILEDAFKESLASISKAIGIGIYRGAMK